MAAQEVKACRKHGFARSQYDHEDRSSSRPSVPEEWLSAVVP